MKITATRRNEKLQCRKMQREEEVEERRSDEEEENGASSELELIGILVRDLKENNGGKEWEAVMN